MRTVHWLFVVSVALFVSGIGFVIAGGRTVQVAAPAEEVLVMTPVASIRQICADINASGSGSAMTRFMTGSSAHTVRSSASRRRGR